eukprot:6456518-Amphidinium_carterae.1
MSRHNGATTLCKFGVDRLPRFQDALAFVRSEGVVQMLERLADEFGKKKMEIEEEVRAITVCVLHGALWKNWTSPSPEGHLLVHPALPGIHIDSICVACRCLVQEMKAQHGYKLIMQQLTDNVENGKHELERKTAAQVSRASENE